MKRPRHLPIALVLRRRSLLALVPAVRRRAAPHSLDSDDVAVVGDTHVTKPSFDTLLSQAKRSYASRRQAFPKQGTTEYETDQGPGRDAARPAGRARREGATLWASRSPTSRSTKRLDQIKKQYFGGSEKKYKAQLKKQHLTDAQVRDDVARSSSPRRSSTRSRRTSRSATPTCTTYYIAAPAALHAAADARRAPHPRQDEDARRLSIYAQLKAGNDADVVQAREEVLAGPELEEQRAASSRSRRARPSPTFDKVAFSQQDEHSPRAGPRRAVRLVRDRAARPSSPRSDDPRRSRSRPTIKQQLLQQKKNQAMTDWVDAA